MSEAADAIVNALNAPFWDGAARGELRLPHCAQTARAFWPPSPISPFTSGPVDWRRADPQGVVRSVVVYRRAFQKAFEPVMPYGVALIELDCGPRLMAHVRYGEQAAVRVGDRATIAFEPLLPGARPAPTALRLGTGIGGLR